MYERDNASPVEKQVLAIYRGQPVQVKVPSLPKLEWQDCGLQSDQPLLELMQYEHSPDPIVYGANNTIAKRWRVRTGGLVSKHVSNITEHVTIARQRDGDTTWETYFENSFNVCDPEQHPSLCPIDLSREGAEFDYRDRHSPSHSAYWPRFRVIERYWIDGIFGGCATVRYSQNPRA